MNAEESIHALPLDTHKQNVADFFSYSKRYWSEAYSASGADGDSFDAYAKKRRKELVLELLDRYAGERKLMLLDVGCGPGLFLEEAARRGHKVCGVDLSEEMIQIANARLKQRIPTTLPCVIQGDIERLPIGSGSVDVVLCLGVLPYLKNEEVGIEEICRVLKNDGFAIVVMPNLIKLGSLLDPYYYLVRGVQYLRHRHFSQDAAGGNTLEPEQFRDNSTFGIRRYTASGIRAMFCHFPFTIVETRGIDYGPFTFWKRRFIPDRISVAVSSLLASFAVRSPFSWMTAMANEWVFCMTVNKISLKRRNYENLH